MGRSLSPLLRQELANLDKDASSRQSAMKALKSYAQHLDTKNIPQFLAEVSDKQTPCTNPSGGEFTISLYEVLARVHGKNIVPQIESIMRTIMGTLASSGGSFPLHQACSKVVPAVARYAIDSSTPDEEKTRIVGLLCKPLCDSLMVPLESTASGSALCLKALVETNNWKFASNETVNEVCLKVAGALHEKSTQSNAHMGLVMALVKHNGLIAEAYARSLVRSGLRILDDGSYRSSQQRLSAIQMINFLMKFVDPRSIQSELENIISTMEKCQSDRMPFVRGAAFEACQTGRSLATQKGSRHEIGVGQKKSPCRSPNVARVVKKSTDFTSPESQIVDSSIKYGNNSYDSPVSSVVSSVGQCSINFGRSGRSNRKLWRSNNNGDNNNNNNNNNNNDDGNGSNGVDVSLKDGLFLRGCLWNNGNDENENVKLGSDDSEVRSEIDQTNSFSGFATLDRESVVTMQEENTPSPQRHPWNGMDDIKICSTPRKLFHSLQSSCETSPESARATKSSNEDAFKSEETKEFENLVITTSEGSENAPDGNESIFSTEEEENGNLENIAVVVEVVKPRKSLKLQIGFLLSVILFAIVAAVFLSMCCEDYDDRNAVPCGLVPT